MSAGRDEGRPSVAKFQLSKESELRIEATQGHAVTVTLLSGEAEILGVEMAQNKAYSISNRKLPVFTWHGCELSVSGPTDFAYTASETPMPVYANTFGVIHSRRKHAEALREKSRLEGESISRDGKPVANEQNLSVQTAQFTSDSKSTNKTGQATIVNGGLESEKTDPARLGPRVIIMGPPESGKSTLASLLLSYSVKACGKSLFVDLDITRNAISVPGSISASTVSKVDIEEGPLLDASLSFFYGYLDPNENRAELERLVASLGSVVSEKLAHPDMNGCGYIASVGGWIESCSRDFIGSLIESMRADVVLVIGAERMFADVKQAVEGRGNIEVVDLPRSGGVVRHDKASTNKDRFKQYFYGQNSTLNPFKTVLDFSSVSLYKVGGGAAIPASALPIGAEPTLDPNRIAPIAIQSDLIHSILAVSQAKEESEVSDAPVAGYVHVAKVDMQAKRLTLLAPAPGELPSRILMAGTLKWLE
mmetsp:Transcript_8160/g.36397  ORF Transcript_8160/g.36397 Transcript_8160/m.36397 type:complete len:478 (+) Transcript_8160:922-2355(+)